VSESAIKFDNNNNRQYELRYLNVLSQIASRLKSNVPLDELCSDICTMTASIMRYHEKAMVRVQLGSISRASQGFHKTSRGLIREFEGADKTKGCIEVYYLSDDSLKQETAFLDEEEVLFDNIINLLSGAATKAAFDKLLSDNTEREKELGGIARIISILQKPLPVHLLLHDICNAVPDAWQYPQFTGARITYGDFVFATDMFSETPWMQKEMFRVPEGPSGTIEVCYTKELPPCDEGPFLKEERSLITNLAQLLAAAAGSKMYEHLIAQNRERLKELNAINQTTLIISHGRSIQSTLKSICNILPDSMQFPKQSAARIIFDGKEYASSEFEETPWVLREQFITIDNQIGTIEVFYLCELPASDNGPFLKEECDLLRNIARLIAHFVNNHKGRLLLERSRLTPDMNSAVKHNMTRQQHTNVFSVNSNCGSALYFVRNILFIAKPYDAFVIQSESSGIWNKRDPIDHNDKWSAPQITVVNTPDQALEELMLQPFDMIFIMAGPDIKQAADSLERIGMAFPEIPIYTLVNRHEHVKQLSGAISSKAGYKQIFVWSNDPMLLFALVKLHEDSRNAIHSHNPIILVVEDTPEILSKIITRSCQALFDWIESRISPQSVSDDDYKCDLPLRPHLLAVSNYEAAVHIVRQYQDRLCCAVSDIEFDKSGIMDHHAGLDLIKIISEHGSSTPCLLHSSDLSHKPAAAECGICFLDKNIPDLLDKIAAFITLHLREGIFTLRDTSGRTIGQTGNAAKLIQLIENAPVKLVIKSLHDGEFTRWFLGHGEQANVDEVKRLMRSDENDVWLHGKLVNLLKYSICERYRGSAVRFENTLFFDESFITVLCGGSFGGKGRGIAFLNSIARNFPSEHPLDGLSIHTPSTAIIGTDEFDRILKLEAIRSADIYNSDYSTVKKLFLDTTLSKGLRDGLRAFVTQCKHPVAVRSSGLFEDSLAQPFAGAFETYIIPNSDNSIDIRLEQIEKAVKLVFASLFRPVASDYFKLSRKSVQEERMAVVIQELVGTEYGSYYYPHISGVAGSFNYYPVSHMEPDDGFAVIAFGLGAMVVEGRSGHRFSPTYPEISFGSVKDALNNSQVQFFAASLTDTSPDLYRKGEKAGLALLDMESAEKAGALVHCASVYDPDNEIIVPDLTRSGPRIIDFADILKYNYIPLAETLKILLKTLSERMGSPVEIEFAVTLPHKCNNFAEASLYLLQVKPLSGEKLSHTIDDSSIDPEKVLMYSENALGNGIIESISDLLIVDPVLFDKLKTGTIAMEVDYFNRKLTKSNTYYILIGPGRWGTRDKSLGVPVMWSQISNARVIVELGLINYPLDASLGSHFFHNLTATNAGYLAINENRHNEIIKWDALSLAETVEQQSFVKHLRFQSPLHIEIDGSRRIAAILRKEQ